MNPFNAAALATTLLTGCFIASLPAIKVAFFHSSIPPPAMIADPASGAGSRSGVWTSGLFWRVRIHD